MSLGRLIVVKWIGMKRLLIFVLALSLAGLGSMPLSACALFHSPLTECATPQTQSQCDHMNMEEGGIRLSAASAASCCDLSKAPAQQAKCEKFSVPIAARVAAVNSTYHVPAVHRVPFVSIAKDVLPPPSQSLLCTFLI